MLMQHQITSALEISERRRGTDGFWSSKPSSRRGPFPCPHGRWSGCSLLRSASSPASADNGPGPSFITCCWWQGAKRTRSRATVHEAHDACQMSASAETKRLRENFLILWACLIPSYHLPFPLPNYLPHQLSLTFRTCLASLSPTI